MKRHFYSLLAAAVLVPALTLASHHALAQDAAPAAPAHSKHKQHHHAMKSNSAGQPVEGRLNEDMSPDHGFASNNEPTGTGTNGRGGNEWHDTMERNREQQHREVRREEAPQAKHHERHHAKHKHHHKH